MSTGVTPEGETVAILLAAGSSERMGATEFVAAADGADWVAQVRDHTAAGRGADAVIEAQTLEVKELLEVIEVIDVTAEKEIDESSNQAPDPEVAAILEEAVREETETPAEEE